MPPKTSKGKGKETKAAVPESELVKMRKKFVVFAPSLDAKALKRRYQCMWARETQAHPATRVIPGAYSDSGPDRYQFFTAYFYCGLCPPFSDFFIVSCTLMGFAFLISRRMP
jgi:hypothetical protein